MPGRLENKIALVTGGSNGFGESMVKLFCKEGAKCIIADIADGSRVEKEVAGNGGKAKYVQLDVTNKESWKNALDVALKTFGPVDILINNAGGAYNKQDSLGVTEEDFDRVLTLNSKSIYLSTVVMVPHMAERKKGVIINTSSVAGSRVRPGQVWYGGTKAFVDRITQGLAAELGPSGIRVLSIAPVRGNTQLLPLFSGVPDSPEERARFAQTVPLRRMSEPDDVANATLYLASDEASYISGGIFPIDGGRLAV